MSFIEKKGIKPKKTNQLFVFSREEIVDLVKDYILQEIGLNVDLKLEAGEDLDSDSFSVVLL